MSEPIAVAYVEVRPETDEFRTQTERELAGLGDDFTVQGQVELEGLDSARRDIDGLTDSLTRLPSRQLRFDGLGEARTDVEGLREDLGKLSTDQLQFAGLEDAIVDTEVLRKELSAVASIELDRPVKQFTSAVDKIAQTGAFSGVAADAHAAGEGLAHAGHGAEEAGEGVGHAEAAVLEANAALVEAGTSGQKFGTGLKTAGAAGASGMRAAAAASREAAVATAQARVEEEKLDRVRVRSRRSQAVGAFRFAGIGLLAGSAIFGATRAIGDLQLALQVTGNEASTTVGKLRNVGASLLSGDVVGAFRALTNETKTYGHEQLEIINETPGMTAALIDAGRGADLLKSKLEELAHVAAEPIPQFIQAQIAQAREQGDPAALRAALEKARTSVEDALDEAHELRGPQKELTAEVKDRRDELAEVRREIAGLVNDPEANRLTVNIQTGQVGTVFSDLTKREAALVEELNAFVRQRDGTLPAFHAAEEALANAKREQKDAINEAIAAEAEDTLAPLAEALTDARLSGSASRIRAALAAQAAALLEIIKGYEGSAKDRKAFKDALLTLNREIESTQSEINAEADRHRQAMIDDRLAESEEAILDATISGSGKVAALQTRANEINTILARGTIGGKRLSRDDRVSLKNELISVNGQIESEQDRITAENERHADSMKAKISKADQAFLDTLGGREAQLRNEQAIEQGRARPAGDIRVSNELQRFFRESIKLARSTIADKKVRDETVADLENQLAAEQANERSLAQQDRRERRERREESLDLSIDIAVAENENVAAERRARQAKIKILLVEQIETTRRGSVERKRLRAAIARERAELRDLNKEKKDDSRDSATTLADLFTQTAIGRQAGFDAGLPKKAGDLTQPIEDRVKQQIDIQASVKSPFERTGDKLASSNDQLRVAIERLTATIPNLTGSTAPRTPSPGEVAGLRGEAMAQHWARRARQLAQESASA